MVITGSVRILQHPTVKDAINGAVTREKSLKIKNTQQPYRKPHRGSVERQSCPVFITGRFRSGTTLLWNLFRNTDGFTSYYEPFNERRWFDKSLRGSGVDQSHIGVDEYWSEYDNHQALDRFYDEDWTRRELFMDERSWNPDMEKFIEYLIDRSPERPVLQFNRVDFRLQWLRHYFPRAKILHVYRNPREQWLSFLTDQELMNAKDVELSYVDNFYLDIWCDDLKHHFPFLSIENSPHPYQRFYYLWKLSYLFGRKFADLSFEFEKLASDPLPVLKKIYEELGAGQVDYDRLLTLIKKPRFDKFMDYAEDDWFSRFEDESEIILDKFLTP